MLTPMNESDIIEIINILKAAVKNDDWDSVEEAITYLQEYVEDNSGEEEDY